MMMELGRPPYLTNKVLRRPQHEGLEPVGGRPPYLTNKVLRQIGRPRRLALGGAPLPDE